MLGSGFLSTDAARVLMIPGPQKSHVNFFSKAGKALQDDGHAVYVLTPKTFEGIVDNVGVNKLVHEVPKGKDMMTKLSPLIKKLSKGEDFFFRVLFAEILPAITQFCIDVNRNKELMNRIKSMQFDLVVNDGVFFYSCLYVIPYRLDLKYITLSALHNPWLHGIPAMPSVEPTQLVPFTNKMSFFQRVANVIPSILISVNPASLLYSWEILNEFAHDKPYKSLNQLMSESELTLINHDVICSGYPRISSPSYLYIGGSSATPVKPLPKDLQHFADGAKHGLIVLSFGSMDALQSFWPVIKPKFMGAFKRLPLRAIVQYALNDVDNVPENVKLSKWLPQNDLLGHPNTKLFITHGGNNGQLEAIYHGVPLLTLPFAGDQEANGAQAMSKGFGLMLNRLALTEEDIFAAITEIVYNTKYGENVKKCSAIQKSLPSPQESFVLWVNHILKFGGDHLKSPASDMPMYQVLMLDVLFFYIIIIMMLIVFVLYVCRFCVKKCCLSMKQKRE